MHALAAYLRPLSNGYLCLAIVGTSFPGLVIASFCFGPVCVETPANHVLTTTSTTL